MAIIYSYPLVSTLDSSNLFPLTATNEEDELYVANVQFSTLASEISKAISGTDNVLAKFSSAGLVDSSITDDGLTVSMPVSRRFVIGTSSVSGTSNVAFGESHTIDQNYCFAAGQQHTLTGANDASALGFSNTASGAQSLATGSNTTASGPEATSFGLNTTASGARAIAAGFNTVASGENSFVVGKWNLGGNNIFEVGIGTSDAARKNAIAVNGNTEEMFFNASAVMVNATDPAGADFRVGGIAVIDSILSVGGNLLLGTSSSLRAQAANLEVYVGAFESQMLNLNGNTYAFSMGDVTESASATRIFSDGSKIELASGGNIMLDTDVDNSFIQLGGIGTNNRLDDYEEGTFSPTFTAGSGGGTLTIGRYNLQDGFYTKVGQQVTVTARIAGDTVTKTGSATLQLSGLPFTISTSGAGEAKLGGNISGGSGITNLAKVNAIDKGNNDTSVIFLYDSGSASNDVFASLNITNINGDYPVIKVTLTYFTTQ
jgi:hypothetical protein